MAQGTINTYAGSDALFQDSGQPAISARLVSPNNIAIDSQGNIYFSDSGLSMVLKVSAGTGIVSIYAGNGLTAGGGDGGYAVGASLLSPQGLALDSAGNLYIVDAYASNVRKVSPNGLISTVAGGQGAGGFAGDGGPATQALLRNPTGIAVDQAGNLYIADRLNQRIRMVSATSGNITTIAGSSQTGFKGDGGPAANATFTLPTSLAIDAAGNLYVADQNNCAIRKFAPGGTISTVAGSGKFGFSGDGGQATKALLSGPQGVAVDSSGNIYIADSGNQRIRYVNAGGAISTIAGTGAIGFSGDGSAATAAQFSGPAAVAVDASGNVYVADLNNNRVRRFSLGGTIATFAGTVTPVGDNGPARQARVEPWAVALDSTGNLYIADRLENRVRKVTQSGIITTVAGTGAANYSGDNIPATEAALNTPNDVAVDPSGNVYIADASNNRIRRVDASTGKITTVAGTGQCCYAGTGTGGDGGPATAATLFYPTSVAVDGSGNIYFVDSVQTNTSPTPLAVRKVTTDGKIQTWAGGGSTLGYAGDGSSPRGAQFGSALQIRTGPDGSLYIADQLNNRVRKIDPAGSAINTVAGNGSSNPSGDGGPAISAGIAPPWSVVVDTAGDLYIGFVSRVRKVTSDGTIGPYAGSGQYSFSGDGGPAVAASLSGASGLAVDSANNLYISDAGNRRVRQVQPAAPPVIDLSAPSIDFSLASTGSTPTKQSFVLSNSGQGTLYWASSASTTSGGNWLSISPASGSVLAGQSGTSVTVTANPSGLAAGDYYGVIQITSPSAASPVQILTVRLTVVTPGEDPPAVAAGGVLNVASYALSTPVAPGSIVAIFGTNFTDASGVLEASSLPLPTNLGGTSVSIGGEPVPLYAVTSGQINAMLPFDLAVNTSIPIVVTRNNAVSAPQPVSMVSSQPGVFTQTANGQGTGIVVIVHPDGSQVEAGNGNAATAGDALVVYCTGLGDVSPRAIAGFPASPSPLSYAIDTVTATISGVDAPAFFAGLTPGFAGLYQVNVTVPSGIAANSQAPLVLSQGGRTSAVVSIPMK